MEAAVQAIKVLADQIKILLEENSKLRADAAKNDRHEKHMSMTLQEMCEKNRHLQEEIFRMEEEKILSH
jgi:hypothetical protein